MSTQGIVRARTPRAWAMLLTALLGVALAADAQPTPSPPPASSAGRAAAAPDPAILWTFDSGG